MTLVVNIHQRDCFQEADVPHSAMRIVVHILETRSRLWFEHIPIMTTCAR
jgi:hypothetical protein